MRHGGVVRMFPPLADKATVLEAESPRGILGPCGTPASRSVALTVVPAGPG